MNMVGNMSLNPYPYPCVYFCAGYVLGTILRAINGSLKPMSSSYDLLQVFIGSFLVVYGIGVIMKSIFKSPN